MAANQNDNECDNENDNNENYYFSDSAYDSDKEVIIKYNHKFLCAIFQSDNVSTLKKVLKCMTPKEIFNNVGFYVFCYDDEEDNLDPYISIRCFKYLIKRGLNINEQDKDGNTPLHYACMYNPRAIYYLLRNGADPNIVDERGDTPIKRYIHYFYNDDEKVSSFLREAMKYGFKICAVDDKGKTLLDKVSETLISSSKLEIFKVVLNLSIENGFDINHQDKSGNTFIHRYILSERDVENFVKIMFERGFNFELENKEGISVIDSITCRRQFRRMNEGDLDKIIRDKIVKTIKDLQFPDVKDAL